MKLVNPFHPKGYVYLMRYKYSTKYKIGWSRDPYVRLEYITTGDGKNEPLEGVRLIKFVKVWNPEAAEKWLHEKWASENFIFRGSGRTEWFRFNWLELAFLEFDFVWVVLIEYLTLTGYVLGVLTIIALCFLL